MSFLRTITCKGKRYRQLVESKWNPKKKRSEIHVIKHMGKVIKKNGKEQLIPSQLKIDSVDKSYPVGKLALYWKIAEEFKIQMCVSNSFNRDKDDISMAVLILVLNQLIGRKPLTKLQQWVSETPIPRWTNIDTEKLTRDYFLSALDKISKKRDECKSTHAYDIQNNITNAWREVIGYEPEQYLFFQDITRIKWNGKQSDLAERGYGAQTGRHHIGLGLVISKENYMPVMGYPVRGSHHDSTTFKQTIDNFSRREIKNITFAWDRDFLSESNIDYARDKQYHILSAGKHSVNEVIDWITKYDDSDIEKREHILDMSNGEGVYYVEEVGEMYGHECRIVIMLDPTRRNYSRTQRDLLIRKLKSETSKKKITKLKNDLKPIVETVRGRIGYRINEKEEERARRLDGRSLYFCTDISMSGEEIIRTYFQKDVIEKAFRSLKGGACLAPIRYQSPQRVEAYLSVINFIAYELIAAISWKIKKHKLNVSYEELLEELSKIHEVEFTSKKSKIYRWTHISMDTEKMIKPFKVLDFQT